MASLSPDVSAALASLRTRWGAAAPRGIGALAVAPEFETESRPGDAAVALCGAPSSGQTTVALRLVAEAQAGGAIGAWVDLARSLDPVEAVARGVRLEWLVVLPPETPDEGIAMAGSLLAGRSVDVLVIDLPAEAGSGPPAEVRSGPPV